MVPGYAPSMSVQPLSWEDGKLLMLDQRLLPGRVVWLTLDACADVAAQAGVPKGEAMETLAASRPTAVNLFWALDRIARLPAWEPGAVLAEARKIEAEDVACNRAVGRNGAELLPQGASVLTVCNTGSLATAGYGTALGVIRTAREQGKLSFVYSCETRPRLQGLRLTAWELIQDRIPFASIADGAAGSLMRAGKIDFAIAGADRIAANGDTANKVGTYSLAVLARYHGIPFAIAAPSSTIDADTPTGAQIPIEEREASEITEIEGVRIAPEGCPVVNPAFDVTPAELIDAIVTEKAVFRAPYDFRK